MSREDGFAIADVSTAHLDDDKVRKLVRRLAAADRSDEVASVLMIHLAVVLASWGSGRRLAVDEALPLWLSARPEWLDDLVEVGLLDRSLRLPARSWSRWNGPAVARREARREAGRRGGQATRKPRSSDAKASPNPSGRQAGPSVPSIPTVPMTPPRRSRRGRVASAPVTLAEALAETPFGQAHAARSKGDS